MWKDERKEKKRKGQWANIVSFLFATVLVNRPFHFLFIFETNRVYIILMISLPIAMYQSQFH
jgi:hypothetical protein